LPRSESPETTGSTAACATTASAAKVNTFNMLFQIT
jgi:hypothetical protein